MKKLVLFFTIVNLFFYNGLSQNFIEIDIGLPEIYPGHYRFGDYNNDGGMDIFIAGDSYNKEMVNIYKNNGNIYSLTNISLRGLYLCSASWFDLDNDNDLDLLYSGWSNNNVSDNLLLYRNIGNDRYDEIFAKTSGLNFSIIKTGDLNNDGYYDFIHSGLENIFFYLGNINEDYQQTDFKIEPIGSLHGDIELVDYDNDMDVDILLLGESEDSSIFKIYNNQNNLNFSRIDIDFLDSSIPDDASWGDYNNDGLLDIALISSNTEGFLKIYKNLGNNEFEIITIDHDEYELAGGEVKWCDVDNDGDLDIVLAIEYMALGKIKIYRNDNSDSFYGMDELSYNISHNISVSDYDNDSDIDILGARILFKNTGNIINTLPTPPTNLRVDSIVNDFIYFGWDKASDNETPSSGLTYNMYIKTLEDSIFIMSPMANLSNGKRLISEMGNTWTNTGWKIKKLKPGKYEWGVQTIDNSFAGSHFSKIDTLKILPTSEFKIDSIICLDEMATSTYYGSALEFEETEYNWDFDGGVIQAGTGAGTYTIYWETPGIKEISLYVKLGDLVSDTTVQNVLVNAIPTSNFIFNTDILCGSDTITFTFTGENSNDAIYYWDFDNGNIISGSGKGDYIINWSSPGLKTVSLLVEENGCTSEKTVKTIKVYQPKSSFSLDEVVCENQNTTIFFTGVASDSAIFIWDFDSANIKSDSGNGTYIVNWDNLGTKNVKLTVDDNGCISSETEKVIDHNAIPKLAINTPNIICLNSHANIEYIGTSSIVTKYDWDFSSGHIISGSGKGPYKINWTRGGYKIVSLDVLENGCSSDTSFSIYVKSETQPVEICIVTVDGVSSNNLLVWEKTGGGIDYYNIYKETSVNGIYDIIAEVAYESMSIYLDTNSSPEQHADRYIISAVDTCGIESELSDYHRTMYLSISKGVGDKYNLHWTPYKGFDYGTYYIYKGTSSDNMVLIDSLSSVYNDYTNEEAGIAYYQIAVKKVESCLPTEDKKAVAKPISRSVSNLEDNLEFADNILSFDKESFIKIYPIPVEKVLNIEIKSANNKVRKIELLNLLGKLIFSDEINKQGNSTLLYSIDIEKLGIMDNILIIKVLVGGEYVYRKVILN